MSEPRIIEHHQFNYEILKYSDTKYTHALMRDLGDEGENYIWLLTEDEDEAIKRLKVETNAYDYNENESAIENFSFYIAKIIRKEVSVMNRTRICQSLEKVHGLNSENYREEV